MKRSKKTLVAAMMVVAAGAVIMVGCKKDKSTQKDNNVPKTEQSMSPEEQRVLDFIMDYKAMNQGAKTSGDPVCLEDARWYWETTLNYCHCFPDVNLCNIRYDTLILDLPRTNEEGKIEYVDMLATYHNIVENVREVYMDIDMEDKTLQLVMIRIEDTDAKDNDNDLIILTHTGNKASEIPTLRSSCDLPWYVGPFTKDDKWIWGLNVGNCNGSIPFSDAADQLTQAIAQYDRIHGSVYDPCPNCYPYFIEGPHLEQYYFGNDNPTWLFYEYGVVSDSAWNWCISGENMEMYYEEILQHTHTENMETNPFGYYGYYRTDVKDQMLGMIGNGNDYHIIQHNVYVYYATRIWKNNNGVYPKAIDYGFVGNQ